MAFAAVLAATLAPQTAGAQDAAPLIPGETRVTGVPGDLHIDTSAGDYLSGRIEAGAMPVTADLLGPGGAHLRRVADGQTGSIPFRTVAPGDGLILRLGASDSGRAAVTLDARISLSEQIPPPPVYDSPRIAALAESLAAGGTSDAFWAEVAAEGTPMIERDGEGAGDGTVLMTFLWRGAAQNVRLFGAPSNDHEDLIRLGGSDVWFRSFRVPPDTRLSYQLAPDVPDIPGDARTRRQAILATAQMDPLNRHPFPALAPDRFNQDATVTLPEAPDQPGTPPDPAADPLITRFDFINPRLGNSRMITVSRPRGLDPADPRAVLLFLFDGEKTLTEMDAPRMLDTLTRQGRLPPVVAVFIPSLDNATRTQELPGNDTFADVLADDLLPQVLAQTGLRADPARTVLAGASYGGLGAATVALRRPDAFGNVVSMSGSFWWAPKGADTDGTPFVATEVAAKAPLPVRFFLSAGAFETARKDSAGILETSRSLRDTLRLRGYTALWRQYSGGHDWIVWRGALADGMIALFGR